MSKVISGTKEWSVSSVNCVNGCSHNCRYCYARYNAVERFVRITAECWPKMEVRQHDVRKPRKKCDGRVMFPTTHDITPEVLPACLAVIEKLLAAGNEVLVVSKPHLQCVQAICDLASGGMGGLFDDYRDQLKLRFTVGAADDAILSYWEPGAPAFAERFASLQHAYAAGFTTSVSMEPLLDSTNVVETVGTLAPYVTGTIWIGMMNRIDSRVIEGTDPVEIARIKAGQTPERVAEIYEALKDHPKIRWKESCKNLLGLKLAMEAGLDV